jgi:hypothetical protein
MGGFLDYDHIDAASSKLSKGMSQAGSMRSVARRRRGASEPKNPIEKLSITIERIKNSPAGNEEYRSLVIKATNERLENMKRRVDSQEHKKATKEMIKIHDQNS